MSVWTNIKSQKLLSGSLLAVTLCIGIVIGTTLNSSVSAAKGQAAAPDATPLSVPPASSAANEFTKLAKLAEPSVVNITTNYIPKPQVSRRGPSPQDEEEDEDGMEMFRRFFRAPGGMEQPSRPTPREATGSGFIVDRNGYIITNNHVIEKADTIKVKVPGDETEYKAKVIGRDWETDIAVIKITANRPLPVLKISNSDGVQVGDWAVAIGSPFGLAASVTAGIVSATGRDINSEGQFQRFIQTDAAINPGNSGGPLLNIQGEVIGVNTAIATQSGGYQGIGFALPSNIMVRIYNGIIQDGRVKRGSIGVSWDKNASKELLKASNATHGVLVTRVQPKGPADVAGIQEEDLIVALNGKPVKNGDDLVGRVSELPVNTEVTVTVDRAGAKKDFKLTIEDRDEVYKDDVRFARHRDSLPTEEKVEGTPAKFGISIRQMTAEEKTALKLGKEDARGIAVTKVLEGSFAAEIGLRERDVIVSVNRAPITSPEDLRNVQGRLKSGDAVAFRVLRPLPVAARQQLGVDYQTIYLSGTLPDQQ